MCRLRKRSCQAGKEDGNGGRGRISIQEEKKGELEAGRRQLLLALGGPETTDVELEFLALEDVTVAATGLTGTRRDGGVETAGAKLLFDERVELALLAAVLQLTGNVVGVLGLIGVGLSGTLTSGTTLGSHRLAVVLLVSLTERGGVHLDNAALDERVGTHKLVVRGVVHDTQNTRLGSNVLGTPGKVARLETQSTVLEVAAANTHSVDALGANTRVGSLTTQLKGALLAVVGAASTGSRSLVSRVTSDTHVESDAESPNGGGDGQVMVGARCRIRQARREGEKSVIRGKISCANVAPPLGLQDMGGQETT